MDSAYREDGEIASPLINLWYLQNFTEMCLFNTLPTSVADILYAWIQMYCSWELVKVKTK